VLGARGPTTCRKSHAAVGGRRRRRDERSLSPQLKPEAASFVASEDGRRSCLVVFDMADSSQIPVISEPCSPPGRCA
jgi:hypothetical protein